MNAETLLRPDVLRETEGFRLRRHGRFLVAELLHAHRVLSTSFRNGGQSESIRYLVNHQSCEAAAHIERHEQIHALGLKNYHDKACAEASLEPGAVALMGTAANMNYAAVVEHRCGDIGITAIVTAGVSGNAACASDPTSWREGTAGYEKVAPYSGTINTMLLVSRPLAPNALAGAAMVMAEAKGTALQRLAVRSRYSAEYATGTSTDQYCIASPLEGSVPLTSASTGVRTGELIGRAVRDATLEALRWQNGLEPSYARSIFHALGGHGLKEETFLQEMTAYLGEAELQLLRANQKAVSYEPLVAASAFALASVCDRVRHGILPVAAGREAIRQQAATISAALAAQPQRWWDFYREVGDADPERPLPVVLAALARGWSAKWN